MTIVEVVQAAEEIRGNIWGSTGGKWWEEESFVVSLGSERRRQQSECRFLNLFNYFIISRQLHISTRRTRSN